MKNLLPFSALLFSLLALSACKKAQKNINDYYPALNTLSAHVNEDGTVEVTAAVSLVEGELQYLGFCMDTLPVPDMLKNQKIVQELSGGQFKYTFTMLFNPTKTYYFRSWAASDAGYSYGNIISLSNIKATPIEVPCTLKPNSSDIGLNGSGDGNVYQVTSVSHFSSTWDIDVTGYDSKAGRLKLRFGSALKTKAYTTTDGNPFGDLVYVSVSSTYSSGKMQAGSKVYVNTLSQGVYEITICNAPWDLSGNNFTADLNARFKSPY